MVWFESLARERPHGVGVAKKKKKKKAHKESWEFLPMNAP